MLSTHQTHHVPSPNATAGGLKILFWHLLFLLAMLAVLWENWLPI